MSIEFTEETEREWSELLQGLLDKSDELTALAERFHADKKLRSRFLAATYRCHVPNDRGERCVLAYVYNTPHGIIVHHPAYKISPELNERSSSESGRRVNTLDGDRHWKQRNYFLSQAANLTMNCRHVRHEIVEVEHVKEAVRTDTRNVIVSPKADTS